MKTRYNAAAYIKDNRLCILGVNDSKRGPIPFSYVASCKAPDQKIEIGSDLPPNIRKALDKGQKHIMRKVKKRKVNFELQSLVERARAGDQNAMATIIMIRENAKKGNPKALRSVAFLEQFIVDNPPSDFGADNTSIISPMNQMVIALNCEVKERDAERVVAALQSIGSRLTPIQVGFILANGPKLFGKSTRGNDIFTASGEDSKINTGINLARKIQRVAHNRAKIKTLSPMASWELGE